MTAGISPLPILITVLAAGWTWLVASYLFLDALAQPHIYAAQAGIEVALGLALCAYAYTLARRPSLSAFASPLVGFGTLLMCLAAGDLWALRSVATVGPQDGLCLSHRHWQQSYVRNNELGYWERSVAPWMGSKRLGRFLMVAVGDSFVWGQGLRGADLRMTACLERQARTFAGPNVDVLNFGVPGANSVTEREQVLPDALSLDPDIVLIGYLANDIQPARRIGLRVRATRSALSDRLLRISPSWNALYWSFAAPSLYSELGLAELLNYYGAFLDEPTFLKHLGEIRQLVQAAGAGGARVVFVIMPFPAMWRFVNPAWEAQIYERVEQAALAGGALAVIKAQDMERTLAPSQFDVNAYDHHPGPVVHDMIARQIANYLKDRPRLLRPRAR